MKKDRTKEKERELRYKRRELRKIRDEERVAKGRTEKREYRRRKKEVDQEVFRLERELSAAREGRAEGEPVVGALPDFLVIGAMKGGTTFLYHLLTQHPLVEPAATKEVHFFDALYEEGVEWYRRNFPAPRLKDGRMTITGEATPYLSHRYAPKRMAAVVAQAQLVALLRNPVDRAYSHYHQGVRRGGETRTFDEAVEAEEARSRGERDKLLNEHRASSNHSRTSYLSRGVYVEQLMRWAEHFDEEQMLVLKSEDFFERPVDVFKVVLDFLGLPEWEPADSSEPRSRNNYERKKFKGKYKREMNPETRRKLEEYFGPHNQKLYNYLGRDLGW